MHHVVSSAAIYTLLVTAEMPLNVVNMLQHPRHDRNCIYTFVDEPALKTFCGSYRAVTASKAETHVETTSSSTLFPSPEMVLYDECRVIS